MYLEHFRSRLGTMLDIGMLAGETQWEAAEGEGNMHVKIDGPDG